MSYRPAEAGSIRVGGYVIIDDHPCRVVESEKSKTGKHGSAKVRIVGISLLDGSKHVFVGPADSSVIVPIIDKRTAQVTAILGDTVQLMDLENYEVYELPIPKEPEISSKLNPGTEVEVWNIMDKRIIVRIK